MEYRSARKSISSRSRGEQSSVKQQLHSSGGGGGGERLRHERRAAKPEKTRAHQATRSGGPGSSTAAATSTTVLQSHYAGHGQSTAPTSAAAGAAAQLKRAREIYRPPVMRGTGGQPELVLPNGEPYYGLAASSSCYTMPGHVSSSSSPSPSSVLEPCTKPGLNINAREFVSRRENAIKHSKSFSNVILQSHGSSLQHSKSGDQLHRGSGSRRKPKPGESGEAQHRVYFTDDTQHTKTSEYAYRRSPPPNDVAAATSPGDGCSHATTGILKRSKSLGSSKELINHHTLDNTSMMSCLAKLGAFPPSATENIKIVLQDPNHASVIQLMETVRHIFSRLTESSRYAEPAARLCIAIIEKETDETFLESVLNTCREYYQERDRLLKPASASSSLPGGYSKTNPRWIAYITFLNEMYTQLKRRHVQLMSMRLRNSETAPGLLLLTLLAQCCSICLQEPTVNCLPEAECLFFVLTAIGKDIESELPPQMAWIMAAARDAFFTTVHAPSVRKTLLQLIEMNAACWNLPAAAIRYYYPSTVK